MKNSELVLARGVAEILPTRTGLATLLAKKKIKLYQGFDPTTKDLHLGHLIGARKLAQFQKLGHEVIFLVGDGTGQAGDPSGKSKMRDRFMSKDELLTNSRGYKKQLGKVLDFEGTNPVKILYNSSWLNDLKLVDILEIAQNFSVQQLLERDMFQERLKKQRTINLREFIYPLLQGYDSVAMDVDLEIGGTDQTFNMLAGRTLLKAYKNKEKYVLSLKLFESTDGRKMGKTEKNAINLTDNAKDIFGKIMAMADTFVDPGIELMTDLPLDHQKNVGPLQAKKDWAFETVKQIHGQSEAEKAKKHFEKTFQKGAPVFDKKVLPGSDLLQTVAQAADISNAQTKRLILNSAVQVNGKAITNPKAKIKSGDQLKIGKKTFVTVK